LQTLKILYSDNHLLVIRKPAGMLVQGDRTGDTSLLDYAREYIKDKFNKPGNVYLGLVHRLDRPTSGVVVFALTSKAAKRLSEQFRVGSVQKIYWALVEGKTPTNGTLVDRIHRHGPTSHIVRGDGGQRAELSFRRLRYHKGVSWVEIELATGRHHQIRVQFSHRGHPVIGDFRYGSKVKFGKKALALHARSLTISHPTRKEEMTFLAELESFWPRQFRTL
jgi:RluA family pseudouridine synthase